MVAIDPGPQQASSGRATPYEVAIVGAGFSGLAMARRLKRAGIGNFVVLERAGEVGGTWRDNTYPGATCDVPSQLYSFSFALNPGWSQTFSSQPEIQAYIRGVAEREGLLDHVRFHSNLEAGEWDGEACLWRLTTSTGQVSARALVLAPGPLSDPSIPDLPGLDRFRGTIFHSARWNHDHDLSGERVAVVGTGASAVQFIPQIQPRVGKLYIFQRTPPWVLPRPGRPLAAFEQRLFRSVPGAQRAMRAAIYWGRELYAALLIHRPLTRIIRVAAESFLKRQVPDPELRGRVTPDYQPGCKRILLSNDYLPALGRPNVELVTEAVTAVGEHSVMTADGTEHEVDTIIFGTGFQVTEMPVAKHLRGRDGRTLAEHWEGGMQALRGTTVAGFPNLFLLLGPNTGLGHTSVVFMAEAQVNYVMKAMDQLLAGGVAWLEPRAEAQARWNARIQRRLRGTVWNAGGCSSWYLDRRGINTTLWPDYSFRFHRALSRFTASEYVLEKGDSDPSRRRLPSRVVITGAASGIGAATAAEMRRLGMAVVGLDLHPDGEDVIACDVRDQASVNTAVAAAVARLGGLDILVNCAGVGNPQTAGEIPDRQALSVIDVNLLGPWRVTAASLPALREARGRVINVASGLAHLSLPMAPAYCMSKRGLVAYSDALRLDHGDAITVTTVYPGYMRTPIHAVPEALGLTLEGMVPAEKVEDAVRTLIRAAFGPPARDLATTRRGALSYALLGLAPKGWVDRLVRARLRHAARRGHFDRAELAAGLRSRLIRSAR